MTKSSRLFDIGLVLSFLCVSHVQAFSLFPYRRQIGVWSSSSYTRMAGDPVMEDVIPIVDDVDLAAQLDRDALMPLAPPLTFDKYLTMQDKRVVVTIQYSGEAGLKPYFLTVAKKLKASHPDIMLEKRILPAFGEGGGGEQPTFEVVVDEKVIVGKNNARMQRLGSDKIIQDLTGGICIFVSMQELDIAISKARRRRRPHTMYGKEEESSSTTSTATSSSATGS